MQNLPNEILYHILNFIYHNKELKNERLVCSLWNETYNDIRCNKANEKIITNFHVKFNKAIDYENAFSCTIIKDKIYNIYNLFKECEIRSITYDNNKLLIIVKKQKNIYLMLIDGYIEMIKLDNKYEYYKSCSYYKNNYIIHTLSNDSVSIKLEFINNKIYYEKIKWLAYEVNRIIFYDKHTIIYEDLRIASYINNIIIKYISFVNKKFEFNDGIIFLIDYYHSIIEMYDIKLKLLNEIYFIDAIEIGIVYGMKQIYHSNLKSKMIFYDY